LKLQHIDFSLTIKVASKAWMDCDQHWIEKAKTNPLRTDELKAKRAPRHINSEADA